MRRSWAAGAAIGVAMARRSGRKNRLLTAQTLKLQPLRSSYSNGPGEEKRKVLAVVGLGNVGSRYVGTRHNIGFAAVDAIASHLLEDPAAKWFFQDDIWHGAFGGNVLQLARKSKDQLADTAFTDLVLFKPASMMNSSGGPVLELVQGYQISEENLVVIYDDLDLDVGRLRLRKSGSAGGQNGVKSIQAQGLKNFLRMRLGISRPPKSEGRNAVVSHVLGQFQAEEMDQTQMALRMTTEAVKDLADGVTIDNVMNKFNKSLVVAE